MATREQVGNYRLLGDFSTAGGGTCQWAQARDMKSGQSVFLKKFLSPTYPLPDGPGSIRVKEIKRERCQRFEKHQKDVTHRIRAVASPGGSLAVQLEFFLDGAHYYKVTEWIEGAGHGPAEVATMPLDRRLRVLGAAAKGLQAVHQAGVVHGDLKPANIMVRTHPATGEQPATLIDFDSSFVAAVPPSVEEIVGDFVYYSPEMLLYVRGDSRVPASLLSTTSDVFAFGLLIHQYLTGEMPGYDRDSFATAAEAAAAGEGLGFSSGTSRELRDLLSSMFSLDPMSRPTMHTVATRLKEIRDKGDALEPTAAPIKSSMPVWSAPPTRTGTLKVKGLSTVVGGTHAATAVPVPPPTGALRISGLSRSVTEPAKPHDSAPTTTPPPEPDAPVVEPVESPNPSGLKIRGLRTEPIEP